MKLKKYRILILKSWILIIALVAFLKINGFFVYADDSYVYDNNGRVIEVLHDDGTKTTYSYDENENLISVRTIKDKGNLSENTEEPSSETDQTQNNTTEETGIAPEKDTKTTTEVSTEPSSKNNDMNSNIDDNTNVNSDNQMKYKKTDDNTQMIFVVTLFLSSIVMCLLLFIIKRNGWQNDHRNI